jgi:hypothetical protein
VGRKPEANPCTEEHEPRIRRAIWVSLLKKVKPVITDRVVT